LGRKCKVCSSSHRDEYENMFLSGYEIKSIYRYAKEKYKENFSYDSIRNHMNNHVEEYIEARVRSSRLREKVVTKEVYKQIEISRNLRTNIERLQQIINDRLERINSDEDLTILLALLREARQLYELLLKYDEKIDLKPDIDKEELYNRVIECLINIDIPNEYIVRFEKEWEQYESKSS
jgi:hypothetical protein